MSSFRHCLESQADLAVNFSNKQFLDEDECDSYEKLRWFTSHEWADTKGRQNLFFVINVTGLLLACFVVTFS